MLETQDFYNLLTEIHGSPRGDNEIKIFSPFGSKTLDSLVRNKIPGRDIININGRDRHTGTIILHDQEPLLEIISQAYKQHRLSTWPLDQKIASRKRCEFTDDQNMLLLSGVNLKPPILCHSQTMCSFTQHITKGFIHVHYFFHAMVSRFWYNRWQRHPDVQPGSMPKPQRFLCYSRGRDGTRAYRNSVIHDLANLHHMRNYNFNHSLVFDSSSSAIIDTADAQRYSMHVVLETLFDNNSVHLTEKIFKPMVMSQPFVIFGPPRSLEYLRSYGFQTFGAFWDEGYDLIDDHQQRYHRILDLLNTLDQLTDLEFQDLLVRCLAVVDHNRKLFFSQGFTDLIMDEALKGLSQAVYQQHQEFLQWPGKTIFDGIKHAWNNGMPMCYAQQLITQELERLSIYHPELVDTALLQQKKFLIDLGLD